MLRAARTARLAAVAAVAAVAAGCHTVTEGALKPAVLAEGSAQSRAALVRNMDRIAPRGRIDLIGHDPTKEPVLVVKPFRPSPQEGNSPAVPEYYDLVTDDRSCFARERISRTLHKLPGVSCRPK